MSCINSVRNLQTLYFSKKRKEIKKFKNGKKVSSNPHLCILLYTFSSVKIKDYINRSNYLMFKQKTVRKRDLKT